MGGREKTLSIVLMKGWTLTITTRMTITMLYLNFLNRFWAMEW
jgi:hypothetical protein